MTKRILLLFHVFAVVFCMHSQKIKVDGVSVVVGENIVLDSDVQKFKQENLTIIKTKTHVFVKLIIIHAASCQSWN